jgi:hypothetical protein
MASFRRTWGTDVEVLFAVASPLTAGAGHALTVLPAGQWPDDAVFLLWNAERLCPKTAPETFGCVGGMSALLTACKKCVAESPIQPTGGDLGIRRARSCSSRFGFLRCGR